ncbi:caspase family protein [Bradyrhizobium sp. HKCCYLS2038]|uniref:caspase family protein n=1 Tax=unclassified Bradyrhizobium TaxID=2631580 RepID=UPI003EB943F4
MTALRSVAVLLLALWIGCGAAHAERRVALVIGNSAYRNVAKLTNPANDAALVAKMFKTAGFESVTSRFDLNINEMRKALREFAAKARDAQLAVIYYAGHGIELDGINYLIPTDATIESDTDVLDEALSLDRMLVAVEPAKQLRLVILDACRDNPFAKTMKRTMASRSIGRGLAKVEPNAPNTMIAFAAKAGSTAADGDAGNSPFATALAEHLPKPGLDLRKAFGFVRDDVLRSTGNRQEPYVYGSLGGEDVSLVPAPAITGAEPKAIDNARHDYELALQAGDKEAWEAYLQSYPSGFYANLARVQLKKMVAEEERLKAERRKATEQARIDGDKVAAAEKRAGDKGGDTQKMAAIVMPATRPGLSDSELATSLQLQLRRVGCFDGAASGNWDDASTRALTQFNGYARTNLETSAPSLAALEVLKARTSRACPLSCETGYRTNGESCVKIVCQGGSQPRADGSCEPTEKSAVKRDSVRTEPPRRSLPAAVDLSGPQPGEPPSGTIPLGARVTIQSSACGPGKVLELIGGSNRANIPRQRRCVAAN